MGYFDVFRALLGVFALIIIGEYCDLYGKVSCFTLSMCLRNFGSNILRVCFKLKKVSFSEKKSKRKAMNRNWCNQKANPALNTKAGNK